MVSMEGMEGMVEKMMVSMEGMEGMVEKMMVSMEGMEDMVEKMMVSMEGMVGMVGMIIIIDVTRSMRNRHFSCVVSIITQAQAPAVAVRRCSFSTSP